MTQDEIKEGLAQAIYKRMTYPDRMGTKPEWVPHGNSHKQEEARDHAQADLDFFAANGFDDLVSALADDALKGQADD